MKRSGLVRALDGAAENQRLDLIEQKPSRSAGARGCSRAAPGSTPRSPHPAGCWRARIPAAHRDRRDRSCPYRRSARRARRRRRRRRASSRRIAMKSRCCARCARSRSSRSGSTTGNVPASSRATRAASRSIARVESPCCAAAMAEHRPKMGHARHNRSTGPLMRAGPPFRASADSLPEHAQQPAIIGEIGLAPCRATSRLK